MNKNTARIRAGISELAGKNMEVISGNVVAGSIDEEAFTISVALMDGTHIDNVMLNTSTNSEKSFVIIPKENSNVVIGRVDGPGSWILIRAGEASKVSMVIAGVKYIMDDNGIAMRNGGNAFNIGDTVFKMNTSSESLFQWLSDLVTAISAITVILPLPSIGSPTSSGVPVNSTTFATLSARLNNLLGT